ncbi:Rhythmically expressed gene 2 protein [Habropoda laboriosa]|uniref:Rhythmically expressed gene 2 protein n=1 Tax=Habropoda laboriosa TaxID=597456 RepID=A0A0L7R9G1_9HYME|nr:PREDICTED: rhythmically expressed gene 2 protein-like [Habropoda laboriosa]XP_017787821.1 PREDICTED: rhythmically expressed gene 2 protein-like [Habropoda laboriosa]XP_017787822.1 PREDICTED: rhythmically expressed gene 2 protein-like [Habropoda laboriosa]KOC67469.1 Rhythmically expressed gene 2 protein [Habropoda laboriosa]
MIKLVRPRLITFDVTGTLLMTKLEEYYAEIGSQHGLSVDSRKLARSFKNNFHRLSLEHPIYGKHTGIGWENWWRQIVHNVFKDQHSSVSDATLDKVANNLISCYGTSMCWHKYPGTIELLEYLQKRGLILGVISNFDERLEAILEDTRIRFYFSFVLTSYDFGVEKPDTSIFDEALRLTKEQHRIDVAPQEAIHIGDSVNNDYIGAKNSNWNALLIQHDSDTTSEKKVPTEDVFRNLRDLRIHLSTLLNRDMQCA